MHMYSSLVRLILACTNKTGWYFIDAEYYRQSLQIDVPNIEWLSFEITIFQLKVQSEIIIKRLALFIS